MRIEVLFLGGQWTRELLMTMMMVMSEDQSQVHVTAISGYWGFSGEEPVLNRLPGASMWEGGSILTQHQSNDRKLAVNATLAVGHQAHPARCYKFHILQQVCSTQYYTIIIFGPGKTTWTRNDSRGYTHACIKVKLSNFSQINIFKSCMSMLFQQLTLPETNTFKFLIN